MSDIDERHIWLENFKLLVEFIIAGYKHSWDVFNIFTILNSALFGLSFTEWVSMNNCFTLLLCLLGIIMSVSWFLMMARTFANIRHFTSLARDIEINKLTELKFFKAIDVRDKSLTVRQKVPVSSLAEFVTCIFIYIWILRILPVLVSIIYHHTVL